MWLRVGDVIAANDDVEDVIERGDAKATHGPVAQLARDDAEPHPRLFHATYLGDDSVVRFYERIVVREVVPAVRLHHLLDLFLILGDLPELGPQRCAEALDPHVVGGQRLVGAVQRHGVAIGAEDQLDGIDDRAIEVKEKRGERHPLKVMWWPMPRLALRPPRPPHTRPVASACATPAGR